MIRYDAIASQIDASSTLSSFKGQPLLEYPLSCTSKWSDVQDVKCLARSNSSLDSQHYLLHFTDGSLGYLEHPLGIVQSLDSVTHVIHKILYVEQVERRLTSIILVLDSVLKFHIYSFRLIKRDFHQIMEISYIAEVLLPICNLEYDSWTCCCYENSGQSGESSLFIQVPEPSSSIIYSARNVKRIQHAAVIEALPWKFNSKFLSLELILDSNALPVDLNFFDQFIILFQSDIDPLNVDEMDIYYGPDEYIGRFHTRFLPFCGMNPSADIIIQVHLLDELSGSFGDYAGTLLVRFLSGLFLYLKSAKSPLPSTHSSVISFYRIAVGSLNFMCDNFAHASGKMRPCPSSSEVDNIDDHLCWICYWQHNADCFPYQEMCEFLRKEAQDFLDLFSYDIELENYFSAEKSTLSRSRTSCLLSLLKELRTKCFPVYLTDIVLDKNINLENFHILSPSGYQNSCDDERFSSLLFPSLQKKLNSLKLIFEVSQIPLFLVESSHDVSFYSNKENIFNNSAGNKRVLMTPSSKASSSRNLNHRSSSAYDLSCFEYIGSKWKGGYFRTKMAPGIFRSSNYANYLLMLENMAMSDERRYLVLQAAHSLLYSCSRIPAIYDNDIMRFSQDVEDDVTLCGENLNKNVLADGFSYFPLVYEESLSCRWKSHSIPMGLFMPKEMILAAGMFQDGLARGSARFLSKGHVWPVLAELHRQSCFRGWVGAVGQRIVNYSIGPEDTMFRSPRLTESALVPNAVSRIVSSVPPNSSSFPSFDIRPENPTESISNDVDPDLQVRSNASPISTNIPGYAGTASNHLHRHFLTRSHLAGLLYALGKDGLLLDSSSSTNHEVTDNSFKNPNVEMPPMSIFLTFLRSVTLRDVPSEENFPSELSSDSYNNMQTIIENKDTLPIVADALTASVLLLSLARSFLTQSMALNNISIHEKAMRMENLSHPKAQIDPTSYQKVFSCLTKLYLLHLPSYHCQISHCNSQEPIFPLPAKSSSINLSFYGDLTRDVELDMLLTFPEKIWNSGIEFGLQPEDERFPMSGSRYSGFKIESSRVREQYRAIRSRRLRIKSSGKSAACRSSLLNALSQVTSHKDPSAMSEIVPSNDRQSYSSNENSSDFTLYPFASPLSWLALPSPLYTSASIASLAILNMPLKRDVEQYVADQCNAEISFNNSIHHEKSHLGSLLLKELYFTIYSLLNQNFSLRKDGASSLDRIESGKDLSAIQSNPSSSGDVMTKVMLLCIAFSLTMTQQTKKECDGLLLCLAGLKDISSLSLFSTLSSNAPTPYSTSFTSLPHVLSTGCGRALLTLYENRADAQVLLNVPALFGHILYGILDIDENETFDNGIYAESLIAISASCNPSPPDILSLLALGATIQFAIIQSDSKTIFGDRNLNRVSFSSKNIWSLLSQWTQDAALVNVFFTGILVRPTRDGKYNNIYSRNHQHKSNFSACNENEDDLFSFQNKESLWDILKESYNCDSGYNDIELFQKWIHHFIESPTGKKPFSLEFNSPTLLGFADSLNALSRVSSFFSILSGLITGIGYTAHCSGDPELVRFMMQTLRRLESFIYICSITSLDLTFLTNPGSINSIGSGLTPGFFATSFNASMISCMEACIDALGWICLGQPSGVVRNSSNNSFSTSNESLKIDDISVILPVLVLLRKYHSVSSGQIPLVKSSESGTPISRETSAIDPNIATVEFQGTDGSAGFRRNSCLLNSGLASVCNIAIRRISSSYKINSQFTYRTRLLSLVLSHIPFLQDSASATCSISALSLDMAHAGREASIEALNLFSSSAENQPNSIDSLPPEDLFSSILSSVSGMVYASMTDPSLVDKLLPHHQADYVLKDVIAFGLKDLWQQVLILPHSGISHSLPCKDAEPIHPKLNTSGIISKTLSSTAPVLSSISLDAPLFDSVDSRGFDPFFTFLNAIHHERKSTSSNSSEIDFLILSLYAKLNSLSKQHYPVSKNNLPRFPILEDNTARSSYNLYTLKQFLEHMLWNSL